MEKTRTKLAPNSMGDKEKIYDEQISPLMDQIIRISKEHGIPFVAQFQLRGGEDPLLCSTSVFEGMGGDDDRFRKIWRVMRPEEAGPSKMAGIAVSKGPDGVIRAEVSHSVGYSAAELEEMKKQAILTAMPQLEKLDQAPGFKNPTVVH